MKPTRYVPYRPTQITPPGATLADLLEERQISLGELAEALAIDGAAIAALLTGELRLTSTLAHRLATFTNVPTDYWLCHERAYRRSGES